ncbi:MAG: hypothetical protein JWM34_2735 [Ilumatobacteraceae bacterium]|nr:hypothetical protein [Ilumatobacteraceae bacterium]
MNNTWVPRLIVFSIVAVLAEVSLVLNGMGPRVLLVGAVLLVGGAVACVAFDIGSLVSPPAWPRSTLSQYGSAGVEQRVGTLRMLLRNERRSDGYSIRLYDALVGLIDDWLLAEHNVDRAVDPAEARRLIGPELVTFIESGLTVRTMSDTQSVARIVTLIENL